MTEFDVVDLTSELELVQKEGLSHDERIRFAAALVSATGASNEGRQGETIVYHARHIEEYIRNG